MVRTLLAAFVAALLVVPGAHAAPWVGSANYTAAPSATGDEDAAVGPFETYNFGIGAALIQGAQGVVSVGDTLTGAFQSYVGTHEYNSGGGGTAAAPHLNTAGAGAGYELTIAANFTEVITSITLTGTFFNVTGGTAALSFDTTPDFSFANDVGFNGVDTILQGTVIGGTGAFVGGTLGVTSIDIRVDSFDTNVYDPDSIATGTSIFTLQVTPTDASFLQNIRNGANSVQGISITNNDLLLAADGNLSLLVPEPASLLLVSSVSFGLLALRRRRI